ncbi:MAG: LacI family DNA-binding transcriptional regulator, partial [Chloroflexota bacterium]
MVTMRDVASEVGLSVTTVSRALNNFEDVAELTRLRIQEVARRLDYHPNVMARGLQTSRANAIGLVIPPILHLPYDAFWLEFIGGMSASCAHAGVDLLLSPVDAEEQMNQGFKRLIRGRRVDGLLICDVRRSDPRIAYLRKHELPFVAFGRTTGDLNYPYIDVDGAAGAMQAMDHLVALGHRHIAYLGVDPDFSFSHFRLTGYRQALEQAGLQYDTRLVFEGLTGPMAAVTLASLLSSPNRPTAILVSADFLARETLKVAQTLGISIPDDLSIIVFDDSLLVQQSDPPLT